MRISYDEMYSQFVKVLMNHGMDRESAELSAKLFADSSRDGVHTHGLNRFPAYVKSIDDGFIKLDKKAIFSESYGVLERWDGQQGPGNINAHIAMNRAIEIAKENTVGIVALKNNNHWMRPGNYGLMAAENDCIGILWTNTIPNMPPWGGKDNKTGNNPLVMAVPYKETPVLLDIAMAMFSYGKLDKLAREGKETPVDGGYDQDGNLTRDPSAILKTRQVLPMGFWKGSGLSILLDLIVMLLSGGLGTRDLGSLPIDSKASQIFIAISLSAFSDRESMEAEIEKTIAYIKSSEPLDDNSPVRYPGEGMYRTRLESLEMGVYADDGIWERVLKL